MSTLVAIAYPSDIQAKSALATLESMQREQLITIDDAVVARHDGDKIKLDQALSTTGAGALGGALWGGLFGLIFLMPIVGMAVGAASGAIAGKLSDVGVDDNFAKEMAAKLEPGKVALVLLVRQVTPDRVIAELKKQNLQGEIIQTNLSAEAEEKLRAAVAA
jgi:uncharacterized membrane protein